ncbi:MAG TPA: type II toxin-antitoxin system RelE/ParE family toxin [Candidatus Baltobacteraceae bacterium]|nr:type II toxin-antitoxin system RelE/ParE family toxin [Candidatus Baltobacteraceae bacterium]
MISAPKRVAWLGTTASDIARFPEEAKLKLGRALRVAQGGDVIEIVAPCDDGTYRLMYALQLGEVIYVLHTFKKKSHRGKETPRRDLALIEKRFDAAKTLAQKP